MLAPFSLTSIRDANDNPLPNAVLAVYQAGTTTPVVLYKQADYATGTEHPNPIPVNGSRLLPVMYGAGSFKFRALSAPGGPIVWEADGVTLTDPVVADTGEVENTGLVPTGAVLDFYGAGSRPGYVRLNGRTIGNAASGSTERAAADTRALYLALWTEDDSLVVVGGRGQTAAADFDAGKALTLPDARARLRMPVDGMGNTASGALAGVTWSPGGSATRVGSYAGGTSFALGVDNIPAHTHSLSIAVVADGAFTFNGTTGNEGANHIHSLPIYSLNIQGGSAPIFLPATGTIPPTANAPTSIESVAHGHAFNVTVGNHTHGLTYSMGSIGSGAAFSVLPPVLLVTTYIKL